ncbi:MAG: hypothetical protein KKA16_03885 [Alphaproteobacteria bacterium]|nr:hypothetical protein [Alphaproteobacteria bacterium]MBU2378102.1 hypothetical protein [Alphaproteobacteria bacterium]
MTMPYRPPGDLTAETFENVDITLTEMFVALLRKGQTSIDGRRFVNCRFQGPAVLLSIEGNTFDSVNFGFTDGDIASLILRQGSPTRVVGAIGMRHCVFERCEFFGIGFTGPEEFLQTILDLDPDKAGGAA